MYYVTYCVSCIPHAAHVFGNNVYVPLHRAHVLIPEKYVTVSGYVRYPLVKFTLLCHGVL